MQHTAVIPDRVPPTPLIEETTCSRTPPRPRDNRENRHLKTKTTPSHPSPQHQSFHPSSQQKRISFAKVMTTSQEERQKPTESLHQQFGLSARTYRPYFCAQINLSGQT